MIGAMSAVVVLGTIGVLLHEGFTHSSSPPRIEIAVDSIVRAGAGYLVEFSARNRGESTAAGLRVEGEIVGARGSIEVSHTEIDYVPGRGVRAAGLFFSQDPAQGSLRIRPTGYDRP